MICHGEFQKTTKPCPSICHTEKAAWWLSPTPLKNGGVKVSWDDDIPNMLWKISSISLWFIGDIPRVNGIITNHVPNHQADHHHIPSVVGL